MRQHRSRHQHRRGMAAVITILLMVMLSIMVIGLVRRNARDFDLTVRRVQTLQAFYAAEAGTQMAMRELALTTDEDGDGTIGTISDDANDANDRVVGNGIVVVVQATGGSDITLRSEGRSGESRREISSTLQ
ncbi:MAG: hypothetical protein AAF432_04170 [Planctomycetota bacterium]